MPVIFCRMMIRSLLLCLTKMERIFYVSCLRWRKPRLESQLLIRTLVAWLWKLRNGLKWRRQMNYWKYWNIDALSEWASGSYKLFVSYIEWCCCHLTLKKNKLKKPLFFLGIVCCLFSYLPQVLMLSTLSCSKRVGGPMNFAIKRSYGNYIWKRIR